MNDMPTINETQLQAKLASWLKAGTDGFLSAHSKSLTGLRPRSGARLLLKAERQIIDHIFPIAHLISANKPLLEQSLSLLNGMSTTVQYKIHTVQYTGSLLAKDRLDYSFKLGGACKADQPLAVVGLGPFPSNKQAIVAPWLTNGRKRWFLEELLLPLLLPTHLHKVRLDFDKPTSYCSDEENLALLDLNIKLG